MLVLSILHNIFLTDEEINQLFNKKQIEVIGVSLPVWYFKGNTSEPAEEVFCKYTISNNREETPIKTEVNGFVVNIPQVPDDFYPSDSEWNEMTQDEKVEWAINNPRPPSLENIYPESKNGYEVVHFKEYNKIKKNNKFTTIIHIFEIKPISSLLDSID